MYARLTARRASGGDPDLCEAQGTKPRPRSKPKDPNTVDSKTLEYGLRVIYAGFTVDSKELEYGWRVILCWLSFFELFWDQRTLIFKNYGFYCRPRRAPTAPKWSLPTIRGPFWGVSRIRILVYLGHAYFGKLQNSLGISGPQWWLKGLTGLPNMGILSTPCMSACCRGVPCSQRLEVWVRSLCGACDG